jgi:RNA polymerase primary sigma factor
MAEPEQEQQTSSLKALIARGKEQHFLTYAEITDHLPADVDPEQIEEFINMLSNDIGIKVYETPPDIENLLLTDNLPEADTDEEAVEEAERALKLLHLPSAADNNKAATTDPVRIYMREMGSVPLLDRHGEIIIARRIEEGIKQMLTALSQYPELIADVISEYDRAAAGEIRLSDIIIGYTDMDSADEPPVEQLESLNEDEDFIPIDEPLKTSPKLEDDEESDDSVDTESELDTGPDPEIAAQRFNELRELYQQAIEADNAHGRKHKKAVKAREKLAETFMKFKLTPRQFDKLANKMRSMLEQIRAQERFILDICVNKAKMQRKAFISSFPGHETDLDWLKTHLQTSKPYAAVLQQYEADIMRAQKKLLTLQQQTRLNVQEIKEINRQMSIGDAKARLAKKEMVEANLRLVISIAKK